MSTSHADRPERNANDGSVSELLKEFRDAYRCQFLATEGRRIGSRRRATWAYLAYGAIAFGVSSWLMQDVDSAANAMGVLFFGSSGFLAFVLACYCIAAARGKWDWVTKGVEFFRWFSMVFECLASGLVMTGSLTGLAIVGYATAVQLSPDTEKLMRIWALQVALQSFASIGIQASVGRPLFSVVYGRRLLVNELIAALARVCLLAGVFVCLAQFWAPRNPATATVLAALVLAGVGWEINVLRVNREALDRFQTAVSKVECAARQRDEPALFEALVEAENACAREPGSRRLVIEGDVATIFRMCLERMTPEERTRHQPGSPLAEQQLRFLALEMPQLITQLVDFSARLRRSLTQGTSVLGGRRRLTPFQAGEIT